jgi:hypothetical protein
MIKKLLFFIPLLISTISNAQGTVIEADSTNFEVNDSLVQIDTSASNIWQIGLPLKTFFGVSHSAPFAIMTDSINPYPVNNLSSFTISMDSCQWDVFPGAYISFWHKYETDSFLDGGYVEFSADSGNTWVNVVQAYSIGVADITPYHFYSEADTILGDIPAFSGTQNSWVYSEIYLQWMFGVINPNDATPRDFLYPTKIMFRFNFKSDNINTMKAGWIIDNIEIGYRDVGGHINLNQNPDFEVHLFPNPLESQSIIQVVSATKEKNLILNLSNSLGQLVLTKEIDANSQFIIEKKDLKNGIYFYSVSNNHGQNTTGKLIIK